jgi:hypothetical protein
MCLAGTTSIASLNCFGAYLGFATNEEADGGAAAAYSFPAASTGITYALSDLPSTGARLIVELGATTSYCVVLTESTGTVMWPMFNTMCYDNQGVFLTGPPSGVTDIEFEVTDATTAATYSFCVTGLAPYIP